MIDGNWQLIQLHVKQKICFFKKGVERAELHLNLFLFESLSNQAMKAIFALDCNLHGFPCISV